MMRLEKRCVSGLLDDFIKAEVSNTVEMSQFWFFNKADRRGEKKAFQAWLVGINVFSGHSYYRKRPANCWAFFYLA